VVITIVDETLAFKHFDNTMQNEPYENLQQKTVDFLSGKGVKNAKNLVGSLSNNPINFKKSLKDDQLIAKNLSL
jgi:hypothetical protein